MLYLLFAFYLVVACFVVSRINFINSSGLPRVYITPLFLIKVSAGLALGWVFDTYYHQGNDYWDLNAYGIEEYQLMLKDPQAFATNLFDSNYADAGGFFSSTASFWNDLENNILIKILAVLNIFSRGNYYLNSLFFNFFGFFGHIALYRIFVTLYPRAKTPLIAGCFLLPTALFFCSGINKDNAIFTLLCLFCYAVFFSYRQGFNTKRIVLLVLSFVGILLMRNYVALALLPGLLAWFITDRFAFSKKASFIATFGAIMIGIAALGNLNSSVNAGAIVAKKQADFFSLGGAKSQLQTDTLAPSITGLLRNAPQAFNHGFLRPYLWEAKSFFTLIQAIELTVYLCVVLFFITRLLVHLNTPPPDIFLPFIVISCCLLLMLIGYIVPNTHSIVRYRSIYLPFIMTPVLCGLIRRKTQTY